MRSAWSGEVAEPNERIRTIQSIADAFDASRSFEQVRLVIDQLAAAMGSLEPSDLEYLWSVNEVVFGMMRTARRKDPALAVRLAGLAVELALRIRPGDLLEGRAREQLGLAHESAGSLAAAILEYERSIAIYFIHAPPKTTVMGLLALCTALASLGRVEELEAWSSRLLSLASETGSRAAEVVACAHLEQCAANREDWSRALSWVDEQCGLIERGRNLKQSNNALADLRRRAEQYREKLGVTQ